MNIELLYVYIGENNTPITNMDICFSHEYYIKYNEKSLVIEKKATYPYKGFYGNYIKSYSLIVGKNGSGKTTLLNFLGLCSQNLTKYYDLRNNNKNKTKTFRRKIVYNYIDYGCWFALYRVNNQFYIEGYNPEKLFGFKTLNDGIVSGDFSMFIDYDFQSHKMEINSLADHLLTTSVDFYYYKKLSESTLTYFKNPIYSKYSNDYPGHDKYTVRLNRREIECANINNIYKLFSNYKELLIENNFGVNSKIHIQAIHIDYDDSVWFDQILHSKYHFPNNVRENSYKEMFISNMYYRLAFGLWNAFLKKYEEYGNNVENIDLDFTSDKLTYRDIAWHYLKYINKYFKISNPLPNYVNILDGYVDILQKADEKYFLNQSQIEIPLIQHDELIQELLDYHFEISNAELLEQITDIEYTGLSSGEHEYIEVFGSIIKILSEIQDDSECKSRILLLDEPDRTFHPEWASNYICQLTKILNYFGEKTGISFQVIITTHSPFMVSDILKEDIHKIENINGLKKITNSEHGFASNYYDIITDTFFLTSSVGEFAKDKIENVNIQIQQATNINQLIPLKKVIDAIGDKYLKNILNLNYNNKLEEIKVKNKEEQLQMENRISELREELRILERKYNDE